MFLRVRLTSVFSWATVAVLSVVNGFVALVLPVVMPVAVFPVIFVVKGVAGVRLFPASCGSSGVSSFVVRKVARFLLRMGFCLDLCVLGPSFSAVLAVHWAAVRVSRRWGLLHGRATCFSPFVVTLPYPSTVLGQRAPLVAVTWRA